MSQIEILIVEDELNWQEVLPRTLKRLGENVRIELAPNYASAKQLIQDRPFHLAIVDLNLPDLHVSPTISSAHDFQVIEDLHKSEFNQDCSLIVVTAFVTSKRTNNALKQLGVFDFLNKDDFDASSFLNTVKAALYATFRGQANRRQSERVLLSVVFTNDSLSSVHLKGPDRQITEQLRHPSPIELHGFIDRADGINDLLVPAHRADLGERWRKDARTLGEDLLKYLNNVPEFATTLAAGRSLAKSWKNLSLEFHGPRDYLGVPFELLNDENDYLGLNHPIHRRVHSVGGMATRKVDTFNSFLNRLKSEEKKLRVLLIASNFGSRIEAVDAEVEALNVLLHHNLSILGIEHEIQVCPTREATLPNVEHLLSPNRFHLIHYAGHGRFDDDFAEGSGLVFRKDDKPAVMAADALKALLKDSPTYFVYLSCCVGTRTATQKGSGDFLGIMDSIVQADVPAVLGYRWVVTDNDAKAFALDFYDSLFTTFSLEDAVLNARNAIVRTKGRQDETWASPVLVLQNP
jgi:CheY-like chemotaxis protein